MIYIFLYLIFCILFLSILENPIQIVLCVVEWFHIISNKSTYMVSYNWQINVYGESWKIVINN